MWGAKIPRKNRFRCFNTGRKKPKASEMENHSMSEEKIPFFEPSFNRAVKR
jgi:hypothetical protein